MGTDLGGYAIMIGGTSGPHLNSFSLVDVLTHGRACALMNPYYTVFFAPAIENKLQMIGAIYKKYGYIDEDVNALSGRNWDWWWPEVWLSSASSWDIPHA